MRRTHKTVFICYRRKDNGTAHNIYQALHKLLGYDVFIDYEGLKSGKFGSALMQQIRARAHFLIIITPDALNRCENDGDWMRREIEYAIEHGRNIVPLFFDKFDFKTYRGTLPGSVQEITDYQGINVYWDYFDAAIDRLHEEFLLPPRVVEIQPLDSKGRNYAQRQVEKIEQTSPIESRPDTSGEAAAYLNTGTFFLKLEEWDKAIMAYTKSIELNNPEPYLPYMNRGFAYLMAGDFERAIADLERAAALNQSPEILEYLQAARQALSGSDNS